MSKVLFIDVTLALMSSFFLAISPWHIHFSRGGWEVNVATFFITTGFWLFIKSFKKPKLLIFSSLFFVFSLYTYHAARIIVPILVVGLAIIYRKKLLGNLKEAIKHEDQEQSEQKANELETLINDKGGIVVILVNAVHAEMRVMQEDPMKSDEIRTMRQEIEDDLRKGKFDDINRKLEKMGLLKNEISKDTPLSQLPVKTELPDK